MNLLAEINSTYYYCSSDHELTHTHIGNVFYDPRIKNLPVISRTSGSLVFGVNIIDSINIELINTDGDFDSIYSLFINKVIILKIGTGNETNGYNKIFTGKIIDIYRDDESMSLTCEDIKCSLKKNIKLNYYSVSTYANLNTTNSNKPIPQLWGKNIKIKCVCLNEMESPAPANYTFKIVDTTYNVLSSIENVYLNDIPVTYSNVNLTNGTFTITSTDLGSNNFENVTASATNAKNNPVDIIQDIIDTAIVGFSWNTFDMDITRTEGFVTSYYQDSIVDILTAINSVMNDTDLILYSDTSGNSSLKYFNSTRLVTRIIQNHEYIDKPAIENNINDFASSILITYSPSRSTDSKLYHRVATYETEAETWFGEKREIQIDTNLTTTTDAEFKANKILELSRIFRETYTRSILLDLDDTIELFDFVAADPSVRDVNNDPAIYSTYEILGITDDYSNMTKQLILRYMSPYLYINKFEYLTDHLDQYVLDHDNKPIVTGDYL